MEASIQRPDHFTVLQWNANLSLNLMDVNYYQLLTNQMIASRLWWGFPVKATQQDPG